MTTTDHLARAGRLLDGTHAHTVLEAAALSIAHSVHAWVLWEAGFGAGVPESHRNGPLTAERHADGAEGHHDHTTAQTGEYEGTR